MAGLEGHLDDMRCLESDTCHFVGNKGRLRFLTKWLMGHKDENGRKFLVKGRIKDPENCLRFEVSAAATMKNAVFGDVTQCGSCKNRRFGGT
jgi:hypothetical protein